MDKQERSELIRKGNQFFNQGRLKEAIAAFLRAGYKDGLARIGDHFLYERKEPVNALSFYRKAGHQPGINLIIGRIVDSIRTLMEADSYTQKWQDYLQENYLEILDEMHKNKGKISS